MNKGPFKRILLLILLFLLTFSLSACFEQEAPPAIEPTQNTYGININSSSTALQFDGISKAEISVGIQKNNEQLTSLPNGYKLKAYHTHADSILVPTDISNNFYTAERQGLIGITKIDPWIISPNVDSFIYYEADPKKVEYYGSYCVKMSICKQETNQIVYEDYFYYFGEDFQDFYGNAQELYFSWNGNSSTGYEVGAGVYFVEVSIYKVLDDFTEQFIKKSEKVELFVKGPIGDNYTQVPYSNGLANLDLISPPDETSNKEDKIFFVLYDEKGSKLADNETTPLVISFVSNDTVKTGQDKINFWTYIERTVNGEKVALETPRLDVDEAKILKLTYKKDDSQNETVYEYDLFDKTLKVSTKNNSWIYKVNESDENKKEAYYAFLSLFNDLVEAVYKEAGFTYDSSNNVLSGPGIDVEKDSSDPNILYIKGNVDGIDSEYKVNVANNTIEKEYGTDILAGGYTWLEGQNIAYVPPGSSIASVKAQEWIDSGGVNVVSIAVSVFLSCESPRGVEVTLLPSVQTIKQPLSLPKKPEFTSVIPQSTDYSVVDVHGTGVPGAILDIYLNNVKQITFKIEDNGQWQYTDLSVPLGNNELNVIQTIDGKELESGGITLYRGANNFGLVLYEPGSNIVFSQEDIFNNSSPKINLKFKGKISLSCSIDIKLNQETWHTLSLPQGVFDNKEIISIGSLKEGDNKLIIKLPDGKEIEKNIIGAYKFTAQGHAYILKHADFLFNHKVSNEYAFFTFDWIPYDPDHTGVYVGDGKIVDAVGDKFGLDTIINIAAEKFGKVRIVPASDWNDTGFMSASQPLKLINTAHRKSVAARIRNTSNEDGYIKYHYDIPFFRPLGKYDGPTGGFYCSELAYWGWEQENIGFGISKADTMFPFRGNDVAGNSILPAYLCEKSMWVKKIY